MSRRGTYHVDSIFEDAFRKVAAVYPEAEPHGRLFHWEWSICDGDNVDIVAEAKPNQSGEGWLLKVKEKPGGAGKDKRQGKS